MRDREVKVRLDDLIAVLNCIAVKRPEAMRIAQETGLNSLQSFEKMQELLSLYSFMGSSAPHYVKALKALTSERVGNVERIRPTIERRRKRRDEAA